jgi:hypothetical protein
VGGWTVCDGDGDGRRFSALRAAGFEWSIGKSPYNVLCRITAEGEGGTPRTPPLLISLQLYKVHTRGSLSVCLSWSGHLLISPSLVLYRCCRSFGCWISHGKREMCLRL